MENNEDKRQMTVIAEAIDGINQILYEQSSHDYEVDIPRIMEFLESLLPKEREAYIERFVSGQKFEGREQDIWMEAERSFDETYTQDYKTK